jgi:polyhydroxybutyrate depolymerase
VTEVKTERRYFKACAAVAASAALLAAGAAYAGSSASGVVKKTLTADGAKREYYVHAPAAYDAGRSWPLVLVLHGGGGTAAKMDKLTGMNAAADRAGFIACYPQGLKRHWNDGRAVNARATEDVDDVFFLVAVVDAVRGEYNVDPKRVYACGISNGAMMAFRLAADRPDLVAAVAGVGGGVTDELVAEHPPQGPVPVMMVVGDADPCVPFGGGDVGAGGRKHGTIIPQTEGAAYWAVKNGAAREPVVTAVTDADPGDGCTAKRYDYRSDAGFDVVMVVVHGGGHTWPSGWQYLPERTVGKTTRDFGNDLIWEFFAAHPKP